MVGPTEQMSVMWYQGGETGGWGVKGGFSTPTFVGGGGLSPSNFVRGNQGEIISIDWEQRFLLSSPNLWDRASPAT